MEHFLCNMNQICNLIIQFGDFLFVFFVFPSWFVHNINLVFSGSLGNFFLFRALPCVSVGRSVVLFLFSFFSSATRLSYICIIYNLLLHKTDILSEEQDYVSNERVVINHVAGAGEKRRKLNQQQTSRRIETDTTRPPV